MGRHVDFLPLGTVVKIKGLEDEFYIICQRCTFAKRNKDKKYRLYDYGIIKYPIGVVDNSAYVINSDKIDKVIFKGYSDDKDKKLVKIMTKYLGENNEYNMSVWDRINPFI